MKERGEVRKRERGKGDKERHGDQGGACLLYIRSG